MRGVDAEWRLLERYTIERSLNPYAHCHTESLKISIHRDRGSVSPCWILRICVVKALWAALLCVSSRGGSPSHPEPRGDKTLLKKPAQRLLEFVDQETETLLSYIS